MTREEEKIIAARERAGRHEIAEMELYKGDKCNYSYARIYSTEIVSFEAGVEWADRHPKSLWINVNEDLPCNHEELIIKHDDWEILEIKPVFVHYKNGDFGIRHMWKPKNEPWIWFPNTSDIDYWMPIPKLPKE